MAPGTAFARTWRSFAPHVALRRARHWHQRGLQERKRVNTLRSVQRDLKGDTSAGGVPDDGRPLKTEMARQGAKAPCLLSEGKRRHQASVTCVPGSMITNQAGAGAEGTAPQEVGRFRRITCQGAVAVKRGSRSHPAPAAPARPNMKQRRRDRGARGGGADDGFRFSTWNSLRAQRALR